MPSELGILPFVIGDGELIFTKCVDGEPLVIRLPYISADLT